MSTVDKGQREGTFNAGYGAVYQRTGRRFVRNAEYQAGTSGVATTLCGDDGYAYRASGGRAAERRQRRQMKAMMARHLLLLIYIAFMVTLVALAEFGVIGNG